MDHQQLTPSSEEQSMSGYQAACDTWIHLFSCCANQPQQQQKRRNRRIDRMMIGEPTNFQHTGHIGSGEMEDSKLSLMHDQMQSKGGYDNAISPSVLKVH